VIYATTRVNSFTIFLLSIFYCRQNLCQVNRQFFRRTSWWSLVPVDKASNNIVFVCKSYYLECLIKELGINSNTSSNATYNPTSFDKDEILANQYLSLWIRPCKWFPFLAKMHISVLLMMFIRSNSVIKVTLLILMTYIFWARVRIPINYFNLFLITFIWCIWYS
jgi:hypothetical protein